ncbi:MAG: alpha-1,2-fucosyltransferase [Verrucomicrobiota bacterium]|nr:alpha-1,2-fucosyltransferase [Verrucomicrobiota bacterium]
MRFFAWVLLPFLLYSGEGPYVLCDPMGQLGNQFFQIAATVSLALDHGATPIFPSYLYEERWDMPINYEKVLSQLDVSTPDVCFDFNYVEPVYTYRAIPYQPNMTIRGWFQSEKYFRHHKAEILKLFEMPDAVKEEISAMYPHILSHPKSVAVHYRGYMLENPIHSKVYAQLTLDYYKKAVERFPADSLFVVFSDDIAWCKQTFASIPRSFVYLERGPHYRDFYLMSLCKHQIISNSSYSWWAAYLNPNPGKQVIAPRVWFAPEYKTDDRDLVPEEWRRL